MKIGRRQFIGGVSAGLVSTATSYTTFKDTTDEILIEEINLSYPRLPKDLNHFRIGFITDLHLGGWVLNDLINDAVQKLVSSKVDLVLLGGDYIWVPDTLGSRMSNYKNRTFSGRTDEERALDIYSSLAKILSPLKAFATYGVLGNHDRWSHADAYRTYLPLGGVTVLENRKVYFQRGSAKVEIYGTEDLWTGVPVAPTSSVDEESFRIILTHNPDYASYLHHVKMTPFNLALSGHTHGGQIHLPLIGALKYNVEDLRYAKGLVDYEDTKFYTSRGIGVVALPFRVNCPPEVTILELISG